MWRPKDPKAVTLIKLTLWSGLFTWMVFTLATGVAIANLAAQVLPQHVGVGTMGQAWTWIVPIWIIFTTLMLIWAVARFSYNRLRRKDVQGD